VAARPATEGYEEQQPPYSWLRPAVQDRVRFATRVFEERVRQFALDLIRNPETLRKQIEAEAERLKESTRSLERETLAWTEQLAKVQRKRAGYQDQQAEGLMTLDELRIRLTELDEQKAQIEKELNWLRSVRQDRDYLDDLPSLVEDYLRDLPQLIDYPARKRDAANGKDGLHIYKVTPDTVQPQPEVDYEAMGRKYRGLYDDLRLKAVVHKDGTLDVTWGFGGHTALATR
jgi:hypothetical protein